MGVESRSARKRDVRTWNEKQYGQRIVELVAMRI